jgi:hypothetical protein
VGSKAQKPEPFMDSIVEEYNSSKSDSIGKSPDRFGESDEVN